MQTSSTVSWQDADGQQTAVWQSESGAAAPRKIVLIDDQITADAAYWRACAGESLIYQGDFQNARQLLSALTRRIDAKPAKPTSSMLEAFHQHRMRQTNRATIANRILIELKDGVCESKRSPEMQQAVQEALGEPPPAKMLVSLREVLGMIGAHEWRMKGVEVEGLSENIHAHYGVYSPVRGEYLELIANAPVNNPKVAWDIGTGTGVIAAMLVARGVPEVVATDSSSRAIQCAEDNIQRLQMQTRIRVQTTNLFPEGKADLIVCNPPWLPAKASTSIEQAIYDPKSKMVKGYLNGLRNHLNERGEAWLVMSNLAEHIGLRTAEDLQTWIDDAGLTVIDKTNTLPVHSKSSKSSDPLHEARSREVTSLYRLQPTP